PTKGDPDNDIPPGTLFENLPEDWTCPWCAAEKNEFIEVK
ncbi:MAG: rubredoxin, partial [Firmicutes bacterium]|nr:rubredoxin [Bacillota bacterium]